MADLYQMQHSTAVRLNNKNNSLDSGSGGTGLTESDVVNVLTNSLGDILQGGHVIEGSDYGISVNREQNTYKINLTVPTETPISPTDVVIGLCRAYDSSYLNEYNWKYITSEGKKFSNISSDYFNSHPTYSGITTEVIDGKYMVKIPKFYIKYEYEGWGTDRNFWISPLPRDGFHVHPAFMNNGEEIDQFWIGAYQASRTGSSSSAYKLTSTPGVKPLVSTTLDNFNTYANRLNVNGIEGFSVMNIYQISAIRYLMMLEYGTGKVDSAMDKWNWNQGLTSVITNNDSRLPYWRGIYGLFGNAYEFATGCQTDANGNIQILSNQMDGTMVDTGLFVGDGLVEYNAPNIYFGGYAKDFHYETGENYNMSDVQIISSALLEDGATDDYLIERTPYESWTSVHKVNVGNWMYVSGSGYSDINTGFMSIYWQYNLTSYGANIATRLAKI